MNPARAARLPFTEDVLSTMTLFREIGTTVLLVILTLWLQSAGLAALIFWVRRALAGDPHRLRPFRSTALVVQLTAAVIVLHGVLILFWAGCYRCFAYLLGNLLFIFRPAAMPPWAMAR
jgi:hypothetical protein